MKIKNQLLLTITVLAIILLIIIGNIFYTSFKGNEISSLQIITADIDYKVSDLSQISNDYFLFQNNSQLIAWQNTVNGISTDISNFHTTDSQQQQKINTIQNDLAAADNAFNKTVVYLQNTPRNVSSRADPQFQLIWNQLTQSTLKLSNEVDDLTGLLHKETIQNHNATINLIVILLVAFFGFIIIIYYIIYRRTLKSVAELQKGLRIIGKGNFDYSAKMSKNDEIGELSESVDNMTVQLRDLTNNLKNQERMAAIGQTAGMVGHDIRNPLQAMFSDVYLLKDEIYSGPQNETKKGLIESLDSLEENISYVNKIVQDLQDYARPISPEYSKADFSNVLVKMLENVKVPDSVKLSIKVKDLEEFRTDKMLLQRALSNLVTNALQAMPDGGIMEITGHRQENSVIITVSDTGVGIPDEIKPKLFTPMMTTKSKGQGFGLAVSKRLIEAMKGTITFESEKGKGTKFIIELPFEEPNHDI